MSPSASQRSTKAPLPLQQRQRTEEQGGRKGDGGDGSIAHESQQAHKRNGAPKLHESTLFERPDPQEHGKQGGIAHQKSRQGLGPRARRSQRKLCTTSPNHTASVTCRAGFKHAHALHQPCQQRERRRLARPILQPCQGTRSTEHHETTTFCLQATSHTVTCYTGDPTRLDSSGEGHKPGILAFVPRMTRGSFFP